MNGSQFKNLITPLALLIGITLAMFNIPYVDTIMETISTLFINMLKLISLPMIFLAVVSTLSSMTSLQQAGPLLKRILIYTFTTTLIAAFIGMLLFVIIQPSSATSSSHTAISSTGSYLSFAIQVIPENIVQPFLNNNVMSIAFLATIFGIALLKIPINHRKTLTPIFDSLFKVLLQITSSTISLIPIGICAFMFQLTTSIRENSETLRQLLLYGLCVIGANLIQGFIILPLFLKIKGCSPIKTAQGMAPALAMAFFTKSSSATLPLTLNCAQNRLNISQQTAQFSFPLCSIINMNGCAAFILITVSFVCSTYGIIFTPFQMIGWVFLSSLAAIGNAGVPMGCFFLTSAFLISIGVPVQLMGMILPLYSLFDMVETALNIWSDSCITAVVDQEITIPSTSPIEANS